MSDHHDDDLFPLDPSEHVAQLRALLNELTPGARVLDLGAGLGRIAIPLAEAGHDVLAIDTDATAIHAAAEATTDLDTPVRPRVADFTSPDAELAHPAGPTDAAVCLGHTLMLLHDVRIAEALLRRVAQTLSPGGALFIDDFPPDIWADVAEGNWQAGMTEDRSMQLVWAPGDNVIAIRTGAGVDDDADEPTESDRLLRLWSMGQLRQLAAAAGFSDPEAIEGAYLLVLRRLE